MSRYSYHSDYVVKMLVMFIIVPGATKIKGRKKKNINVQQKMILWVGSVLHLLLHMAMGKEMRCHASFAPGLHPSPSRGTSDVVLREPQSRPQFVSRLAKRMFECLESAKSEPERIVGLKGNQVFTSRRDFIGASALTAATVLSFTPSRASAAAANQPNANATTVAKPTSNRGSSLPSKKSRPALEPLDLRQIASENTINVTLTCTDETRSTKSCVKLNRTTYDVVKTVDVPSWVPKQLRRPPRIIKTIPNSELLLAGTVAGSLTEIARTVLFYPLGTIKTRIQADTKHSLKRRRLKRKFQELFVSFRRQVKQGDLYAGLMPTLLVTVPASGVYFGVRDVTKRMLSTALETPGKFDDFAIALLGALVADVVSLVVRTPADVLALRLQVLGPNNVKSDLGNWWRDSLGLLPAIIITDLPYLLARIAINLAVTSANENIGQYEVETITIACTCALLTTPFDVARTRILLENTSLRSDDQSGEDRSYPKQEKGVFRTMANIMKDGAGKYQNLFAGWFERTAYLGARASFDPVRALGFLGIRDAVLLELFLASTKDS